MPRGSIHSWGGKTPLRLIRTLLLIALVGLLLPYLLTPFYRIGHPVSTLMLWRQLTGAPMSRSWIDFDAISPYLPRSIPRYLRSLRYLL